MLRSQTVNTIHDLHIHLRERKRANCSRLHANCFSRSTSEELSHQYPQAHALFLIPGSGLLQVQEL